MRIDIWDSEPLTSFLSDKVSKEERDESANCFQKIAEKKRLFSRVDQRDLEMV